MTTICITIPATDRMYAIGHAISMALNPDPGNVSNFGPEHHIDTEGRKFRPHVYTTYDFPCSDTFASTAQALAADPSLMHAAVCADYDRRWPDLAPPTLADCAEFCAAVVIVVTPAQEQE